MKKADDHLMSIAIASSIASLEYSQPSVRPSQSQPIVPPKKSGKIIFEKTSLSIILPLEILVETYDFLRSKPGRQAIYFGKTHHS